MNRAVWIIDGVRTPLLLAQARPGRWKAVDLAVAAGRALLARLPIAPGSLDALMLGCASVGGDEDGVARQCADRLCGAGELAAWDVRGGSGSGLAAVEAAAQRIRVGDAELVLVGGVEAMSHRPLCLAAPISAWLGEWQRARGWLPRARQLWSFPAASLRSSLGPLEIPAAIVDRPLGEALEELAFRLEIDRAEMDTYTLQSRGRLAEAAAAGQLADQIQPLWEPSGGLQLADEGPERVIDGACLARAIPLTDPEIGRITAGNTAAAADGAAWLLLASEEAIARHGLDAQARLAGTAWAGVGQGLGGLGPAHAVATLLQRHRFAGSSIDAWEIEEISAAQVLGCLAAWANAEYSRAKLGLAEPIGPVSERLNLEGGALGLGHAPAASGVRLILHLTRLLRRRALRRGIAAVGVGAKQGAAVLIEREVG